METPMKTAAIYARVSSDKQKEEGTIASQTAALVKFARKEGYDVPPEWIFEDEGFSGASLVGPGLERLRAPSRRKECCYGWASAPHRASKSVLPPRQAAPRHRRPPPRRHERKSPVFRRYRSDQDR